MDLGQSRFEMYSAYAASYTRMDPFLQAEGHAGVDFSNERGTLSRGSESNSFSHYVTNIECMGGLMWWGRTTEQVQTRGAR
jgi:hypothetical protein